MTREELAQRINLFEKGSRRRELAATGFMIIGLFAAMLISTRFAKTHPGLQPVVPFLLPASIVLPSLVFALVNRRRMRALGLHCPECGRSLDGVTGRLAVTTCNCSRCGKKILEEGTCDPAIPGMTGKELSQGMDSFEKGRRSRERVMIVFLFGGLFIALLIATKFAKTYPVLRPVVLILLPVSFFLPGTLFVKANKRHIRTLGLSCPGCGTGLIDKVGRMAVDSRYCSHCGKKVSE